MFFDLLIVTKDNLCDFRKNQYRTIWTLEMDGNLAALQFSLKTSSPHDKIKP